MTGYWKRLLKAGIFLNFLAGIMVFASAYKAGQATDYSTTGYDHGLLALAVALGAIGQVLLLPGIIGWGIDSSGLTRLVAAPQQPGPPVPVAYAGQPAQPPQTFESVVPGVQQTLSHPAAHRG